MTKRPSRGVTSGELSYLRNERGVGSSANRFTPIGGAGGLRKGYASGGDILVGETGPEVITADEMGYNVVPNDRLGSGVANVNFTIQAVDAAGGVQITGLNDPDGPGYAAINLRAMLGTAALTTKSTSGYGAIRMLTYIKAGTGTAAMTSDGNLLSIEDGNTVRHIFDKEGQMHSSVAPTTSGMDSYDDAQLVRAHALSSFPNGIIESKFDEFIKYNHEKLAELKLVGREEDGTPNHFVNVTKMQQLHNGAIWQQYTEIQKMKELMYETMVELMGKEEANKKLDSHDIKLLDKGILS